MQLFQTKLVHKGNGQFFFVSVKLFLNQKTNKLRINRKKNYKTILFFF
jgi:hypothetical protein